MNAEKKITNRSSKKLSKYINEIKSHRREMYSRYAGFCSDFSDYENKIMGLSKSLTEAVQKAEELKHLIKLYEVCDEKSVYNLWKMETMFGITKDSLTIWRDNFYKKTFKFEIKDENADRVS